MFCRFLNDNYLVKINVKQNKNFSTESDNFTRIVEHRAEFIFLDPMVISNIINEGYWDPVSQYELSIDFNYGNIHWNSRDVWLSDYNNFIMMLNLNRELV